MNTLEILCLICFIVFMIILFFIDNKITDINNQFDKNIENNNLQTQYNFYTKQIMRFHGMALIVSFGVGMCYGIGWWNKIEMKHGVEEYLRGNVEVKYRNIYEDSVLIRCDTIINLK